MDEPIYLMYSIDNFYQNHRNYIKSRSIKQLSGESISSSQARESCDPIVYNKDVG